LAKNEKFKSFSEPSPNCNWYFSVVAARVVIFFKGSIRGLRQVYTQAERRQAGAGRWYPMHRGTCPVEGWGSLIL